jgi:hypothetical protein
MMDGWMGHVITDTDGNGYLDIYEIEALFINEVRREEREKEREEREIERGGRR